MSDFSHSLALQRTAAGHRSCNRRVSWPPSLSLGRYGALRFMKKYITISLALLTAGIAQAQTSPKTSFKTKGTPVPRMLQVYSTLSGKELVIEPSATNQLKTITMNITATNALTKAEAAKVVEAELRKQADIVITPLDDRRVSVTLAKK